MNRAFILALVTMVGCSSDQPGASSAKPSAKRASQEVQKHDPVQSMRGLVDWYVQRHGSIKDQYWLHGREMDEAFAGHRSSQDVHALFQKRTTDIERTLSKYVDASAICHDILRVHKGFYLTEVTDAMGGLSSRFIIPTNIGSNSERVQRMLEEQAIRQELAFVGQRLAQMHKLPPIQYFASWKAVRMVALEIPEKFLAALLFHELYHAYVHRQGRDSATASAFSDTWISEEVEAHELEHEVLNYATGGALNRLYERIAKRDGDINGQLALISQSDLIEYDEMLGISGSGWGVGSPAIAQFYIGYGMWALNRAPSDDSKMQLKRKIDYYRWIIKVLS